MATPPGPHEPRNPIVQPPHVRKPLPFITKVLTCTGLVVAFLTSARAPAGADPGPSGGDPDTFGGLSCSCTEAAPADSPALKRRIRQGIQQGLAVGSRD